MMFLINEDLLKTDIYKNSEIVIYGAGNYASFLYNYLKTIEEDHRIIDVVQTNVSGRLLFNGWLVHSIHDIDKKKECVYIIAMNKIHNSEIRQILFQYGCKRIIFFSDYVLESIEDITNYCNNLSCDEFIDSILLNHLMVNGERIEYATIKSKKADERKICIALPHVCVRTANIANSLLDHGYTVEVFCYTDVVYSGESELESNGVSVKRVQGLSNLFYSMLLSNAFVYLIDVADSYSIVAETIIRKKEVFGKIIYTSYDLCNLAYIGMGDDRYKSELVSLANADGVIWRYYAKDFYYDKYNIDTNSNSVFFPDYFYKSYECYYRNDDNLMLYSVPVYADAILTRQNNYVVSFTTIESIMEWIGDRKDVVYHVFCWSVSDQELLELEELSDRYEQFDFFIHVDHDVLLQQLVNYDYFINISDEDKPLWNDRTKLGFKEEAVNYAMSNRFFEAASIGIPTISTFPVKECDYLSEKGVLIKKHLNQLDIDDLIKNKLRDKRRVMENRDELCMDAHINELIDLFRR